MRDFSPEFFNALCSFEDAVARQTNKDVAKDELVRLLLRHSLLPTVGVQIAHRHFPLRSLEVVIRVNTPLCSFLYPTSEVKKDKNPCAWAYDPAIGGLRVVEYFCGKFNKPIDFSAAFLDDYLDLINSIPQVADFALLDSRTALNFGADLRYELTHEQLRLSMTSPWLDQSHRQFPFSISSWFFDFHEDRVIQRSQTACNFCPHCMVDNPDVFSIASKAVEEKSLFSLPISTKFLPYGANQVTNELLFSIDYEITKCLDKPH